MSETERAVLLVCTANVCRSVYGSAVLASELAGTQIPVTSAGVEAVEGTDPCDIARGLIAIENLPRPVQLDTGARPLTTEAITDAGLVLTFTARQRGLVARLVPSSRDRLFTLLEAVSLADTLSARRLDAGSLEEWAELLHLNRPTLSLLADPVPEPVTHWWQRRRPRPEPPDPWDIPDAHSTPDAVHRERLANVADHCRRLGSILAGTHA